MRFLLSLGLAAFLALPVAARPLDHAEAAKLDKSVTAYLRAIDKGDAKRIIAALPPRILNVYAGATGAEPAKLQNMLIDQTRTLLKGTHFRDLTADQSDLTAEDSTLSDGETVTWVLIPSGFTAVSEDTETQHEQPLLALREGTEWYFLRIDGPERQQLAALAYPFLTDVSFPDATASAVK